MREPGRAIRSVELEVSHTAAMADAVITAGFIAVTAMGGAGAGAAAGALDGAWGGILFGIGHRIGTARGGWMAILRPAIFIRIPTRRCGWLRHRVRSVPEDLLVIFLISRTY